MAEDTGGSVIGLVILCAIGYGTYAYFDKKPSKAEQMQQQQAQVSPLRQPNGLFVWKFPSPLRTPRVVAQRG